MSWARTKCQPLRLCLLQRVMVRKMWPLSECEGIYLSCIFLQAKYLIMSPTYRPDAKLAVDNGLRHPSLSQTKLAQHWEDLLMLYSFTYGKREWSAEFWSAVTSKRSAITSKRSAITSIQVTVTHCTISYFIFYICYHKTFLYSLSKFKYYLI